MYCYSILHYTCYNIVYHCYTVLYHVFLGGPAFAPSFIIIIIINLKVIIVIVIIEWSISAD